MDSYFFLASEVHFQIKKIADLYSNDLPDRAATTLLHLTES